MKAKVKFAIMLTLAFLPAWSDGLCCIAGELTVTDLKPDERIVFLTTDAYLSPDGHTWTVPVHAWVHEFESRSVSKAVIATALKQQYNLETSRLTVDNFDRRVRLFLADNERGKHVAFSLADRTFALPPTGADGHTRTEIQLDAEVVSQAATNGALPVAAVLPEGDKRSFSGCVQLVEPTGVSVISDIDDTVKITHATDRGAMIDHTFFRDFVAVPGMPEFCQDLAKRGARFHFVSSSPRQLYEPLDEFLTASGFPPRSLSLKPIRLTDHTIQNLFRPGTKTKPLQIEPILKAYPQRRFLLVGDSGQVDPEVYAAVLQKYPAQIERILIRNVTNATPTDERFQPLLDETEPKKWQLFTDAADLKPIE